VGCVTVYVCSQVVEFLANPDETVRHYEREHVSDSLCAYWITCISYISLITCISYISWITCISYISWITCISYISWIRVNFGDSQNFYLQNMWNNSINCPIYCSDVQYYQYIDYCDMIFHILW